MHLSFALPELSCKWIAAGTTNKPSPSRTTVSKASRATRPKLTGPLVESKCGRNRSQVLASLERPTRTIPTVSRAKQRPESRTPWSDFLRNDHLFPNLVSAEGRLGPPPLLLATRAPCLLIHLEERASPKRRNPGPIDSRRFPLSSQT